MSDAAAVTEKVEICFRLIRETRMNGVPILNDALEVRLLGARRWEKHWLATLLTPWFMNLLLLPDPQHDCENEQPIAAGTKRMFRFPSGSFEFIRGEEPQIGPYWMCSLFSPVFEFTDQESAEACATAALAVLFEQGEEPSEAEAEMEAVWRGELLPDVQEIAESEQACQPEDGFDGIDAPAPVAATAIGDMSRRSLLTGGLSREERDET